MLLYRVLQAFKALINFILAIIIFFLGARILLQLFGANPATPIVSWVYTISNNLTYPFQGIYPNLILSPGLSLDVVALIALVAYVLIAYLAISIINYLINETLLQKAKDSTIAETHPSGHIHHV